MPIELVLGLILALVLAAALWGPYLYEEIVRGKVDLGDERGRPQALVQLVLRERARPVLDQYLQQLERLR